MTRILKDPAVRKNEIIQAAQSLFETHGYTKTSVAMIIKEADIAKGTFYHYFSAKEDILFEAVELTIEKLEKHFQDICKNTSLSSTEKLQLIFRGPERTGIVNASLMQDVHLPENRALQEHLNVESLKRIAPLIQKIFIQMYTENLCRKEASLAGVQLILAGIQFTLDSGLFDWSAQQQETLMKEVAYIFECFLDAPKGTFNFIFISQTE